MPCLSGQFNAAIGALINVGVLPTGILQLGATAPTQITAFPALIDTGATVSCISPQVVQTVGLQPIGMTPMVSATQAVPVNTYLVDLALPFGAASFLMQGMQVMEFVTSSGSPFQILVGRDILSRGTFTMSFDGHFTFSV